MDRCNRLRVAKQIILLAVIFVSVLLVLQIFGTKKRTNYFESETEEDKQDMDTVGEEKTTHLSQKCSFDDYFDFFRCPMQSGFRVFFYDYTKEKRGFPENYDLTWINENRYRTLDPRQACIFVVVLGRQPPNVSAAKRFPQFLRSLSHWEEDGKNHVLINFRHDVYEVGDSGINFNIAEVGRALVAQSTFMSSHFRHNYDIIIPPSTENWTNDPWSGLQPLYPAQRKYLVSFWGEYLSLNSRSRQSRDVVFSGKQAWILSTLKDLAANGKEASVWSKIETSCGALKPTGLVSEWAICGKSSDRSHVLSQSTFTLLISSPNDSLISTESFQTRLYEALRQGAVPVVFGTMQHYLPFMEILSWEEAVITLPLARLKDVFFILSLFKDREIVELRRHGRFLWETYFSSPQRIMDMTLAVLRTRLRLPPAVDKDEPAVKATEGAATVFYTKKVGGEPTNSRRVSLALSTADGNVSVKSWNTYSHSLNLRSFNGPGDPYSPTTPFDAVPVSEAKFRKSSSSDHLDGGMLMGRQAVFSKVLGGNVPEEKFTVVFLTYKREKSLLAALQRMKGTAFIHKIIVVWNNPDPPSPELKWPDVGVPLEVIRGRGNSLNNRFLPFELIETECVLSVDDDVVLSHDGILFGFRVWRMERDRIVGFLARFHTWSSQGHKWKYTTGPTPDEMSIMMTGCAFLHKYYFYLYTYVMPQAIRDHVATHMNCEDIAMNFLIAHVTRKPPIKVNASISFNCPGCPQSLSQNSQHLEKRHNCMNFFTQVYGYMPLLFTPFAASPHADYW